MNFVFLPACICMMTDLFYWYMTPVDKLLFCNLLLIFCSEVKDNNYYQILIFLTSVGRTSEFMFLIWLFTFACQEEYAVELGIYTPMQMSYHFKIWRNIARHLSTILQFPHLNPNGRAIYHSNRNGFGLLKDHELFISTTPFLPVWYLSGTCQIESWLQ